MKLPEKVIRLVLVLLLLGSIVLALSHLYSSKKNQTSTSRSVFSLPLPMSSPTPYVYHAPTKEQQNYILALGAILSRQNNEVTKDLKSNLNTKSLTQVIDQSWGITDQETALTTINWLRDEGHRAQLNTIMDSFDQNNITTQSEFDDLKKIIMDSAKSENADPKQISFVLDFAWKNQSALRDKSLYAWDYGRLVNVVRWCYTLGWISEEEAWTYLVPAAKTLQSKYISWNDYGENYILGRGFWLNDLNQSNQQKVIVKDLMGSKEWSLWSFVDWNTSLE